MCPISRSVRRVDHADPGRSDIHSRLRGVNELLNEVESRPRVVASRWASLLLALAFLAIVYCTLFPFNFTVPAGQSLRQAAASFDPRVYDPSDPMDTVENIILFLPFGFAVACWTKRRSWRGWMAPVTALAVSALFSGSIETLQLWLPTRDSSVADICSNTTGGLFGALIYLGIGQTVLTLIEKGLVIARGYLTFGRLALLFILVWGATLYSPLHLYHDGHNLANWRPYPLSIGNIASANRPWTGSVQQLEIAAHALKPEDAARVMRGTPLRELFPASVGVAYEPTTAADAPDLLDRGPALRWAGSGRPQSQDAADHAFSPDHWLQTSEAPTQLIDAIVKNSAFTCHVAFTSAAAFAPNMPRIVAISPNESQCNFALMQDGNDLVLRLRTPLSGDNGLNPTWMVHNLFTPGHLKHDVIITYADPMLRLYVDGAASGSAVATPPEFFSLGRLMARLPSLPLGGFGLEIYRALYYLVFFIPLGVLLGLMAADVRTPRRTRQVVAALGVLLPPIVLEFVFVKVGSREMRVHHLVVGAGILLTVLLFARWWIIRHLGRYDSVKSPTNVIGLPSR